jgi:hypothetical protein
MINDEMKDFDFAHFKQVLNNTSFFLNQKRSLKMRLNLLKIFLFVNDAEEFMKFESEEMIVIDMSCSFSNESIVCVLFDVCLELYLENTKSHAENVIALDEAHKI